MQNSETATDRITFLRGLRAVRSFRPDVVPREALDDILEVARWSGSANNKQPWELVVVRRPETLRALAGMDGYVGHLGGATAGILLVMAGADETQETYDEGRLSERIMLAALAHGLGSCIGWFTGAGVRDAKALLGIPEGRLLRTVISLGYPDEAALKGRGSAQPRKQLSEIVHEERYG